MEMHRRMSSVSSIGFLVGCLAFSSAIGAEEKKILPPERLRESLAVSHGDTVYDVRRFGAKGNGKTPDTSAFQTAVDTCHRNRGGIVFVPPGSYLVGTITLRSYVTLQLASAARILGSTRPEDYAANVARCGFVNEKAIDKCLIYAEDAEKISIAGDGIIDGQGAAFPWSLPNGKQADRPMLLRFYRCQGIRIEGIRLQSAASWCCHLRESADVNIHGITIDNRVNANNDGIDLMSTERVSISDSKLFCGDDAICFQNMSDERPVQDITVTNCLMSTRWAGIRSGGAHRGGIRRVAVSNCIISKTYGCGIKLQISGNGSLEDMTFSNIVMTDVSSPISLRLGNCHYNNEKRDQRYPFGRMRNLLFQNIRASVIDEARLHKAGHSVLPGEERQCISICGIPGHSVEGISLSDLIVTYPGGGTLQDAAKREMPELEDQYPEYFMWGVLPAYGLYARHARGLTMNNVRFELAGKDLRPAVVCDDVENLEIAGLKAAGDEKAESLLRLRQTRSAFIHDCWPTNPLDTFLRLEGRNTCDIALSANKLDRVRTVVTPADGAPGLDRTLLPPSGDSTQRILKQRPRAIANP